MTTEFSPAVPQWSRAQGVELLGEVQGSGLVDAAFLVQRKDGQLLQISELLNLVVGEMRPGRSPEDVADAVSEAYGRRLTVAGLEQLVVSTLKPLGLVEDISPEAPQAALPPRINPLLTLRFRGTILPERQVNVLAGLLKPLFFPPVVVLALIGVVALDVTLVMQGGLLEAFDQILQVPVLLLALMAMLTTGAVIHELGHATACKYSGARPGVIGFGIYIVFPAFFTNVTDTYRLGRAGRLRTDLGGLYFNALTLLVAGSGYLLWDQGILLLVVLIMQVQMAQQLIPTLRFDGYFVLADLAGVPDLFNRVKPVLVSMLPGRPMDPLVTEMKPAARWIVTGWVVTVVPTLIFMMGWMLVSLPVIIERSVLAVVYHAGLAGKALAAGAPVEFILAALSIFMVCLPLLGLAVFFQKLGVMCIKLVLKLMHRFIPAWNRPPARPHVLRRVLPRRRSRRSAGPRHLAPPRHLVH